MLPVKSLQSPAVIGRPGLTAISACVYHSVIMQIQQTALSLSLQALLSLGLLLRLAHI